MVYVGFANRSIFLQVVLSKKLISSFDAFQFSVENPAMIGLWSDPIPQFGIVAI